MKKIFLLLFCFASSTMLAACSPQVTVTSEVTVTLPPTATQTSEPSATPTAVYTPTPAQEIISDPRGIELQIGEPIEGQEGAFVITSMEKGEDWATLNGDTRLGFEPEDNQWVYIKGQDGSTRIVLQRVSDNTQIAELKPSGTVAWDWDALVDENGLNILLKGGKLVDKDNLKLTRSAQLNMLESVAGDLRTNDDPLNFSSRLIFSEDGKQVVRVEFLQRGDNLQAGFVCLIGADNKPVVIFTQNFDLSLPFVTI